MIAFHFFKLLQIPLYPLHEYIFLFICATCHLYNFRLIKTNKPKFLIEVLTEKKHDSCKLPCNFNCAALIAPSRNQSD